MQDDPLLFHVAAAFRCGARVILLRPRYLEVRPVSSMPPKPSAAAPTPAMSIQTALSVGEPVKNRDTSELNEFVA